MLRALTQRQSTFVEIYIQNGGNGVDAARRAGYRGNPLTLGSVAHENLKKPYIREEVEKRQEQNRSGIAANTEEKRRALWRIALANKDDAPMIAIAAIRELNQMDGDYKQRVAPRSAVPSIEDILRSLGR